MAPGLLFAAMLSGPAPVAEAPPESAPGADSVAPSEDVAQDPSALPLEGPAFAEELRVRPAERQNRDEAFGIFKNGLTVYQEGRYLEAIEFFALAYETYPSKDLLFSMGQAHRRLYEDSGDVRHRRLAILRYSQHMRVEGNRSDEAFKFMSALLAESELGAVDEVEAVTRVMVSTPVEGAWMRIDGGEREAAPGVIRVDPGKHDVEVGADGFATSAQAVNVPEGATLQLSFPLVALPAKLTVTGPKEAEVAVDGRRVGTLPLPQALVLEPGVHFIAVTRNGQVAFTRQVQVGNDETLGVEATMRDSTQRVLSYTMFGLGGAGVVASGITMGLAFAAQAQAQDIDERLDNEGNGSSADYQRYLDEVEKRDRYRAASITTGAIGLGLMVTGVVLYVVDKPQVDVPVFDRGTARRGPRWTAAPVLGRDMVGASAALRF